MDLKAVPFRSPLSAYEQQAEGLLAGHRAADPAVIDLFHRKHPRFLVLGFSSVDAGRGWLIFALPPAERSTRLDPHPKAQERRLERPIKRMDLVSTYWA
jgi:hypothetical protein